jgi:hypothetical protein
MTPKAPTKSTRPFEREAAEVLQRLRGAVAAVIDALPDPAVRSIDLHRNLKLDRMLSWRLFKVVGAATPLEAGPHVPSPANMRTFLRTIEKRSVPASLVQAVADASAAFERLVERHAGSRDTFDSMVSTLAAGDDAPKIHLQHKRMAFRGQRHIIGVQAKTVFKCFFLRPSDPPSALDIASLTGAIQLRPLRKDARMVVAVSRSANDDGSARHEFLREPLAPANETTQGFAIIRHFCSTPTPSFQVNESQAGNPCCELISEDIGNQAAMTVIEGHVARRAVPSWREPGNMRALLCHQVWTPCEVLIVDVFARKATLGEATPFARVMSEHLSSRAPFATEDERDRIRLDENVVCLGRGSSALRTPDVPRYVEMGKYVFDRLGWDEDEFHVYRCRIDYPAVPSIAAIGFQLPEAPPA